ERVDHARHVVARHRPDAHLPAAVEALREPAVDARLAKQARDDGGASVAGRAAPAHVDPEQVALDGPDRETVGAGGAELFCHPGAIGTGRRRLQWRCTPAALNALRARFSVLPERASRLSALAAR